MTQTNIQFHNEQERYLIYRFNNAFNFNNFSTPDLGGQQPNNLPNLNNQPGLNQGFNQPNFLNNSDIFQHNQNLLRDVNDDRIAFATSEQETRDLLARHNISWPTGPTRGAFRAIYDRLNGLVQKKQALEKQADNLRNNRGQQSVPEPSDPFVDSSNLETAFNSGQEVIAPTVLNAKDRLKFAGAEREKGKAHIPNEQLARTDGNGNLYCYYVDPKTDQHFAFTPSDVQEWNPKTGGWKKASNAPLDALKKAYEAVTPPEGLLEKAKQNDASERELWNQASPSTSPSTQPSPNPGTNPSTNPNNPSSGPGTIESSIVTDGARAWMKEVGGVVKGNAMVFQRLGKKIPLTNIALSDGTVLKDTLLAIKTVGNRLNIEFSAHGVAKVASFQIDKNLNVVKRDGMDATDFEPEFRRRENPREPQPRRGAEEGRNPRESSEKTRNLETIARNQKKNLSKLINVSEKNIRLVYNKHVQNAPALLHEDRMPKVINEAPSIPSLSAYDPSGYYLIFEVKQGGKTQYYENIRRYDDTRPDVLTTSESSRFKPGFAPVKSPTPNYSPRLVTH